MKIKEQEVKEIELYLIDPYPYHPFQVRMDDDMFQLMESIKEHGVITPVILRPKEDGRFETVSGHRRIRACREVGMESVKAEVREMDRDTATVVMVESNFQRGKILPSEKAFAYKMRLEAMKRQGERKDLTSSPLGMKCEHKQALDVVGEVYGDSRNQVHRFIRLTELIPELLTMVDQGKIAFRPAVELSYLKKEEQELLYDAMGYYDCTPSLGQSLMLKELSKEGALTERKIYRMLEEGKPNQEEKLALSVSQIRRLLPDNLPPEKREAYIIKALDHYKKFLIFRQEQKLQKEGNERE